MSAAVRVVVGWGLRAHADAAALHGLWQQALARLPQAPLVVEAVAVLDTKARHPALAAWRAAMNPSPPLWPVAAERLAGQPVATQSPRMLARYATGSVAEALALCAAGPQGGLVVPRLVAVQGSATLAVAVFNSSMQGVTA